MNPIEPPPGKASLRMSQGIWLLLGLTFLKWVIHLYANGSYGFHRDELLHQVCSRHLAWGYMEFPPMIAWLGYLQHTFIGDSLLAVRFLPAAAGAGMVLLTGLMARIMGGGRLAVFLAGVSVLAAFAFWRTHTLFQPVAFDQFFWTLSAYYLLRYLQSGRGNVALILGLVIGLGLLTQYTMLVWASGIALGCLFHEKALPYRDYKPWLGALIALLVFLPNLWWQYQHDWPVFEHLTAVYTDQLGDSTRWRFVQSQLLAMNPLAIPIWLAGLIAFFRIKPLRKYRAVGIAALWSMLVLFALNAKPYYLFSVYPVLFAAGSVSWERWLTGKKHYLIWIWAGLMLLAAGWMLPKMTPIFPIKKFVKYADLQPNAAGYYDQLPSDYANMFGWDEQVALLDSVYRTLPAEEQVQCFIWAENYGEAGAVEILGPKYQLPYPVCRKGSFWLWGTGNRSGTTAISIGHEAEALSPYYDDLQLVRRFQHPYAIEEEQNIPVYLCRQPLILLQDRWPEFRATVFD